MSVQHSLINDVNDVEAVQLLSTKPAGMTRLEKMVAFGIVLLCINIAVLSAVIVEVKQYKPTLDKADAVLNNAAELMDFPNRLIHGSVARAVSALVQTDFGALSRNVTKLSTAVSALFETSSVYEQTQVDKFANLVTSVAKRIGALSPRFPPVPKPADDLGPINAISYLTEWIATQADKTDVRNLARSCTALLEQALTVDWSDTYNWSQGRQIGQWNANVWKTTGQRVMDYCTRLQNLDPTATEWVLIEQPNTAAPVDVPASP